MTNVITFAPGRSAACRTQQRPSRPATIIIFPGVRYERRTAPARPAAREATKPRPGGGERS